MNAEGAKDKGTEGRMSSKYMVNREVYKKVKKYDHRQFEDLCTRIYMSGYKDGRESVPGIDIIQIKEAILEVKGIGSRRMESIMENIEKKFGGNTND